MSITEKKNAANDTAELTLMKSPARRPYARPVLHRDQLLGPILCASQGSGNQPDAGGVPCPPWNPNC